MCAGEHSAAVSEHGYDERRYASGEDVRRQCSPQRRIGVLREEEVVGEMMIPVNHPLKQVEAASTVITGVVFYALSMISFIVASFFDGKKN